MLLSYALKHALEVREPMNQICENDILEVLFEQNGIYSRLKVSRASALCVVLEVYLNKEKGGSVSLNFK